MSVYKFLCCGAELSTDSFANSLIQEHVCNGVPCIGIAFITGHSEPPAETEEPVAEPAEPSAPESPEAEPVPPVDVPAEPEPAVVEPEAAPAPEA